MLSKSNPVQEGTKITDISERAKKVLYAIEVKTHANAPHSNVLEAERIARENEKVERLEREAEERRIREQKAHEHNLA